MPSLAEVADAAGVTRGAIYHHFDSKAELFEAMVDARRNADRRRLRPRAASDADPLGALASGRSTRCCTWHRRRACAESSRSYFCAASTPTNWRQWSSAICSEREQCLGLCGGLLDKAVELGQLPRDTDTRMASHLLYALIGGLMRDWVQAPKSFDLKAAAPQLIDLFMAGLRAAPPRKKRAAIRLAK